ncbi:PP2C family protein-serine/threonine phosphatase [Allosphingosinicella indica]|uniref:Serine/threonine protein phosphatase Stp1 n=1 Tax=Allosphingosinicella indica TaxID=941907 RepID=A0A1X7GJI0_9SPHN|nr:protein phosphatase 2C domain-containing protein [Allosphingosinicella indica]SMF70707.1 serine/threonine protein phosphatase Stp1 [Allosphingosinicella indica]
MMQSTLRIESDAKTHEGRVRPMNEDSFIALEGNGFWAVADGMGGHEKGEWASACVVAEFEKIEFPESFEEAADRIVAAVVTANRCVYAEATQRKLQMGSTIVALYMRDRHYAVFWVGDSRAYRLRGGKLEQLSRDHSQVQEMVDRGLMEAKDAVGHPMGHVLTRAVGVRPEIEVDRAIGEVEPGDTYLLCSDGLHGYVDEAEILRLLGRGSPGEASEQLVVRTLERGAPDNVTVVTVSVSEPTLLSLPPGGDA